VGGWQGRGTGVVGGGWDEDVRGGEGWERKWWGGVGGGSLSAQQEGERGRGV